MTNTLSGIHDEQPGHAPKKWRIGKRIKIAVGLFIAFIAGIYIINQLTPAPFVFVFRQLIGLMEYQGKLGPYANRIMDVRESEIIPIPVAGAPDAGLTIYTPAEPSAAPRPIILFIHGGGWVVGTAKAVSPFGKLLASEGYVVANLDYSLAPEHQYPTPMLQAAAAIDYLIAHADEYGADASQFFIGGNSAGAQISSQLGAIITNPPFADETGIGTQLPAENLRGLILYSGPYNFDTAAEANFPGWRMYVWSYTGQRDYEQYTRLDELSTVKNITADYPPTYLTSGDGDPLEFQTRELDAALTALGVDVTRRYWSESGLNLPHDYQFELDTQAGQTAIEDVLQFLKAHSQP